MNALHRAPGPRRNPWLRLGLFAGACALFLLGYWWGNQYRKPGSVSVAAAILLRPPLSLPEFSLTDHHGATLDRRRLEGGWSLLLVGSLEAPATGDALGTMVRVHNRLAGRPGLQRKLAMVLIAPDPPERLEATARDYGPMLTAAGGPAADLETLTATLGGGGGPAALVLVSPRAEAVALFTADQPPADIAADIAHIVDAAPDQPQ